MLCLICVLVQLLSICSGICLGSCFGSETELLRNFESGKTMRGKTFNSKFLDSCENLTLYSDLVVLGHRSRGKDLHIFKSDAENHLFVKTAKQLLVLDNLVRILYEAQQKLFQMVTLNCIKFDAAGHSVHDLYGVEIEQYTHNVVRQSDQIYPNKYSERESYLTYFWNAIFGSSAEKSLKKTQKSVVKLAARHQEIYHSLTWLDERVWAWKRCLVACFDAYVCCADGWFNVALKKLSLHKVQAYSLSLVRNLQITHAAEMSNIKLKIGEHKRCLLALNEHGKRLREKEKKDLKDLELRQ